MKNHKIYSTQSKILAFFGISLLILFLSNIKSVDALFDRVHTGYILFRFQNEIANKIPAGQYYRALIYRHSPELNQIWSAMTSDEQDNLARGISIFVPGMEAMLEGKGDTVVITNEQIDTLQAQLDELKSRASPALFKDIENEENLFPLRNFVGMTMSDALDFVNSNWIEVPENAWLLGSYPTSMPLPDWHPEEWMHIIHNGVYVEYPYPWSVSSKIGDDTVRFMSPSSTEDIKAITFRVWNLHPEDKVEMDPHLKTPDDEGESVQWENLIVTGYNLRGTEYIWGRKGEPVMYLHAVLYSEENELAMDLSVKFVDTELAETRGYSETIAIKYAQFQLMIYRIQIWNQK